LVSLSTRRGVLDYLPYIHLRGNVAKFTEELQLAARGERFQQNQPNLIGKIQDQLAAVSCPTLILWVIKTVGFLLRMAKAVRSHSRIQVTDSPQHGHVASAGCPEAIHSAILESAQYKFSR